MGLTGLTVLSDRIFLVQFVIPSMLFAAVWYLSDRTKKQAMFICFGLCAAAVFIGFLGNHLISESGISIQSTPAVSLSLASLKYSFTFLWETPLILGLLVVYALATGLGVKVGGTLVKSVLICFLLMIACSVGAPVVANIFQDEHQIRYLLPIFVIPPFVIALVAIEFSYQRPGVRVFLVTILVLLSAYSLFKQVPEVSTWSFRSAYPADVRCLDNIMEKYGIRHGYSDYWNARRASVLSRKKISIVQLAADLKPYLVAVNSRVYYEAPPVQAPGTVLLPKDLDVDPAQQPSHREFNCGGQIGQVLVYE